MWSIANPIRWRMSYDAADTHSKRKNGPGRIKSTDQMLDKTKRKQLQSNALDIVRNYSIAAWAIRKHLDFVSTFSFQAQTDDDTLNDDLEGLVEWASRPLNFDVRGMHGRQFYLRLAETARTVSGDLGSIKLRNGQLQGIESDRIRDPAEVPKDQTWVQGVKLSSRGRPTGYAVHNRTSSGGYELAKQVSARNMMMLGYYDRFDQTRGVGLIASGINTLRDTYENFDYALAKAKVSQLFALKITSNGETGFGIHTEAAAGDTPEETKYNVDFGKGPIKMEMDAGDDADFLESRTPSSEFKDFNTAMIGVALKSLDISYSFFDESFTNFFGSRAALIHYLQSCKWKRDGLIEWLTHWTIWRLNLFVASGALRLPSGMTVGDVVKQCQWVPAGVPWWRPLEEVTADVKAIQAGLKLPGDVTMERFGRTWKQQCEQLKKQLDCSESAGLSLSIMNMEEPGNASMGES